MSDQRKSGAKFGMPIITRRGDGDDYEHDNVFCVRGRLDDMKNQYILVDVCKIKPHLKTFNNVGSKSAKKSIFVSNY